MYRKYIEPVYGEPSFEVNIPQPQQIDLVCPASWRKRNNLESVAELTELMKKCHCYLDLMTIDTTDLLIEGNGTMIPIRIYHPKGKGPFPIMIFFHGGEWCMNNLDVYDYVPRFFANFGKIVVIAVEYRLAPEFPFPIGLEDSYASIQWVVKHAENFSGNINSVTLCGDSSGGNFVAALCLLARDRNGPKIHKQILIYPVTSFYFDNIVTSENRYGKGGYFLLYSSARDENFSFYLKNKKEKFNCYASPLLAKNLKGLPSACIISAECDPLLDHALFYAAKLEDSGVTVDYHLFLGMIHGFINRTYQKTFEALQLICESVPR
ncbi:MAG: alpha/beta hydrolase [Spirochaetia bacterium]|jgi:acetyl esterase|nr:alpha/beta hydrolase [Spirochaetia bacterium]